MSFFPSTHIQNKDFNYTIICTQLSIHYIQSQQNIFHYQMQKKLTQKEDLVLQKDTQTIHIGEIDV